MHACLPEIGYGTKPNTRHTVSACVSTLQPRGVKRLTPLGWLARPRTTHAVLRVCPVVVHKATNTITVECNQGVVI